MAIVIGDIALVYADQFMSSVPPAVHEAWSRVKADLCLGQCLDLSATAELLADRELLSRIAVLKSGQYTIQGPLVLGALLAGRSDLVPCLGEYGLRLGEAFQLADDLQGAFGDADGPGADLEQGRMTLLLAMAAAQDEGVRGLLERGRPGGYDAEAVWSALVERGLRGEMAARIDDLVSQACQAIADGPLERSRKIELISMAAEIAASIRRSSKERR